VNQTLKIYGVARTPNGTAVNALHLVLRTKDLGGSIITVGNSDADTAADGSFTSNAWYSTNTDQEYFIVATLHGHPCSVSPATVTVPEGGDGPRTLEVDLVVTADDVGLQLVPTVPRDVPRMSELGGRLASDLGAMQSELNRYPLSGGVFVVDQMELALPLVTVVDDLGQVRTRVAGPDEQSNAVRFLIRPVFDVPPQAALAADLSLEALALLTPDQITMLRLRRIDDLAGLVQVLRGPTATRTLAASGFPIDGIVAELHLIFDSGLPTDIGVALLQLGITSIREFVLRDTENLSRGLSRVLPLPVSADQVSQWQRQARVRAGWEAQPVPTPTPGQDTV
jgi:hypothetical protein